MTALGDLVRASRLAQGLTRDDVATATGLSPKFITHIEAGKPTAQIGKVTLPICAVGLPASICVMNLGDRPVAVATSSRVSPCASRDARTRSPKAVISPMKVSDCTTFRPCMFVPAREHYATGRRAGLISYPVGYQMMFWRLIRLFRTRTDTKHNNLEC